MSDQLERMERINEKFEELRDLRRFLSIGEDHDLIKPAMQYEDDGVYEKVNVEIRHLCELIVDELEDCGLLPLTGITKGGES